MSEIQERRRRALAKAAELHAKSGDARRSAEERWHLAERLLEADDSSAAAHQFDLAASLYETLGDSAAAVKSAVARECALGVAAVRGAHGALPQSTGHLRKAAELLDAAEKESHGLSRQEIHLMRFQLACARLDALLHILESHVQEQSCDCDLADLRGQAVQRCDEVLEWTERLAAVAEVDTTAARKGASYHKACLLAASGDPNSALEALPHAEEALRLYGGADPRIEYQMYEVAGRAHKCRGDAAGYADAYMGAAVAAIRADFGDELDFLLGRLVWMFRDDAQAGADRLRQLVEAARSDGNAYYLALCTFHRCEIREWIPGPHPHRELAEDTRTAAEVFADCGDYTKAARAYYFGAYQLAWEGMLHPECREPAIEMIGLARANFGRLGDRLNLGMADMAEATVVFDMYTDEYVRRRHERRRDGDAQPNSLEAEYDSRYSTLVERARSHFEAAGCPKEYAQALLREVSRPGSWRRNPEQWLARSRESIRAFENGRALSDLTDADSDVAQNNQAWRFRLVASGLWQSAELLGTTEAWHDLAWALEQAIKARAFQDQLSAPGFWDTLLARDEQLRQATKAFEFARLHGDEAGERAARNVLRHRLEDLQEEGDSLVGLASIAPATVDELQGVLTGGEMYVGYVGAAHGLLRCRVTASEAWFEAIEFPSEIESEFSDLRHRWLEENYESFSSAEKRIAAVAPSLLGDIPTYVDTLLVCPDKEWVSFPWHLIPRLATAGDGPLLTTTVVPSAGTFVRLRQRGAAPQVDGARYLGLAHDGSGSGLGRLKCVDAEVANISATYFPGAGECFTTRSTEVLEALARTSGHRDLLHLACHADVSGLYIAGRWLHRPTWST